MGLNVPSCYVSAIHEIVLYWIPGLYMVKDAKRLDEGENC